MVCLEFGASEFGASEFGASEFGASEFGASECMAKEGALIWHAPEKCPILAQGFLEHSFFEAGHTEQGCADLPNIYWCQPCAGG